MPRPRFLVAAIITVVAVPVLVLAGVPTKIADAYPYDYAKREALARCEAGDSHFIRFLARDRAACYAGLHLAGYSATNTN
jgi:hypothetical protein